MEIRELMKYDLPEAMDLVRDVFFAFEAPEYEETGIRTFCDFIEIDNMTRMVDARVLHIFGAYEQTKLLGIIATRATSHISLFFVRKEEHRKGIGRALFQSVLSNAEADGHNEITVNSSPYATNIYGRLGFHSIDVEQTTDGIRYTPMRYLRSE